MAQGNGADASVQTSVPAASPAAPGRLPGPRLLKVERMGI
jgi:hypothetical protein